MVSRDAEKVRNNSAAKMWTGGFQFTTFCNFPFKNAFTLATAAFIKRLRAARVAQEMWGVIKQFFAFNNGLSASGGSMARTSSPAPAIRPAFKASANADSSINGPRLVLRRKAVDFIHASRWALMRCFVS